jgi:hypothetical protein
MPPRRRCGVPPAQWLWGLKPGGRGGRGGDGKLLGARGGEHVVISFRQGSDPSWL